MDDKKKGKDMMMKNALKYDFKGKDSLN
jgi:hypothetical protein